MCLGRAPRYDAARPPAARHASPANGRVHAGRPRASSRRANPSPVLPLTSAQETHGSCPSACLPPSPPVPQKPHPSQPQARLQPSLHPPTLIPPRPATHTDAYLAMSSLISSTLCGLPLRADSPCCSRARRACGSQPARQCAGGGPRNAGGARECVCHQQQGDRIGAGGGHWPAQLSQDEQERADGTAAPRLGNCTGTWPALLPSGRGRGSHTPTCPAPPPLHTPCYDKVRLQAPPLPPGSCRCCPCLNTQQRDDVIQRSPTHPPTHLPNPHPPAACPLPWHCR